MVDKPETDTQSAHPQKEKESATLVVATTSNVPTSAGHAQAEDTSHPGHYGKYVVWPFVAIWRGVKHAFRFLDRHDGSVTALATVAIVCLTYVYVKYSKKQWEIAQETLRLSNRAFVTLGRKDGVLAEFKRTDDPQIATGILIYFQNSGHLPAKFNWGWRIWATVPATKPDLNPTTLFHPMMRTRNRKTGATGEISGKGVIGGESVAMYDAGELPKAITDQLAHSNQLFILKGMYEYCDQLGTYSCRDFTLNYRRLPYDTFGLMNETDCLPITQPENPEPDTDYLPACETFAEREPKRQQ